MTFPKELGGAMAAPAGAEDVPVGSPEDGWSDERVEALRRLAALGCSAGRIAMLLGGITRGAVIGKGSRLGVAFRAQEPQGQRPKTKTKPTPRLARRPGQPVVMPGVAARAALRFGAPVEAAPTRSLDASEMAIREALAAGAYPHAVGLDDVRPGQCRFPLWSAAAPAADRLFCGAAKRDAACPYCAGHMAIAYRPTALPDRRAA